MSKGRIALLATVAVIAGNLLLIIYMSLPRQKVVVEASRELPSEAQDPAGVTGHPGLALGTPPASASSPAAVTRPAPPPEASAASFAVAGRPPPLRDEDDSPSAPSARDPSITPAAEMDALQTSVRDFRHLLGENPVGTNAEITATLLGDNAKQARVLPPEIALLSAKGELVDRWGTPLFFHQLSKTEMEIRSAGPDATMWNGDDLVVK